MAENLVVREALNDTNYDIWSNCMKIYLVGQDLWDVIEPEVEADESSRSWKRKNALALHALHISCETAPLSEIGKLESAKEAWDLLRSMNISDDESVAKEPTKTEEQFSEVEDGIDYVPFVEASKQGDWRAVKEFLVTHPEANVSAVVDGRTALHHALELGNLEIGGLLVDKTKKDKYLQRQDKDAYTPFACLANFNQPGVIKLLERMVDRNPSLPNIGDCYTVPLVMASWKGFKDTTRYLYGVTDKEILNPIPKYEKIGVNVLIHCINIRLFDIASEIVTKFPKILQQENNDDICPIYALAKSFSALKNGSKHKKSRAFRLSHYMLKSWKYVEQVKLLLGEKNVFEVSDDEKLEYNKAQDFLRLVCEQVSSFDVSKLKKYVYAAMIEASKNGIVELVSEMLIANPNLIEAHGEESKPMFWYAVENRQEKVYNLIYSFIGQKDYLLSWENRENNNILHLAAQLAPSAILDRTSGPALQVQRELQWFQEVWSLAKPRYREDLNKQKLTPRALFTKDHAKLIDDGEKAMKDTAQSSTVVGALIVTVMFAAAFTVPGGNNQDSGLPVFLKRGLFRIFIVCDALSLYSSTTSVLVFLGILTSRYAEEDFFLKLPRKLMIGLTTLFFSITTMMISFCTALALMLDGYLRYVLPTVLLASVPIIIFMSSIVPVLSEMFMSTFGPSIFQKSHKLLEKIEAKKDMVKGSSVDDTKKLTVEEEGEEARNNQTSVEKEWASVKEREHTIMSNPSSSVDSNMHNKIMEEESIANDPSSVANKEDKNIMYNPSSVDELV